MISRRLSKQFIISIFLITVLILASISTTGFAVAETEKQLQVLESNSPQENSGLLIPTTPEELIYTDVNAQNEKDLNLYLGLRSNNSLADENRNLVENIIRYQPEYSSFYDVQNAKVVSIKSVSDQITSEITSLNEYKDNWPEVKSFYVAIDYKTKKESRWLYNGVNYYLYIAVLENNQWLLATVAPAPVQDIVQNNEGFATSDEAQALKRAIENERSACFKNINGTIIDNNADTSINKRTVNAEQLTVSATASSPTCPSSIRVLRTATNKVQTVNFYSYVKNVLPNEWNKSSTTPDKAIQSGALAVKMYGWWRVLHPRSSTYDVKDDTNDQTYTPSSECTKTTNAINAVDGIGFYDADSTIFKALYWKASNGPGRTGPPPTYETMTGWMWQLGTEYWANKGKGYSYMIHYYYDNSDATNNKMAQFFYY